MPGAFRDDLEAARSRAEALDEENEALREELIRLRGSTGVKIVVEGAPERAEDPELARLAERTLEELDKLNDQADASLPAEPPAPPEPAALLEESHTPAPRPPVREEKADLTNPQPVYDALGPAWTEVLELRAYRERAPGRMGLMFVMGLIAGVLVGVLAR
jgi:hypothetical protein